MYSAPSKQNSIVRWGALPKGWDNWTSCFRDCENVVEVEVEVELGAGFLRHADFDPAPVSSIAKLPLNFAVGHETLYQICFSDREDCEDFRRWTCSQRLNQLN
jgi:hypothetical protein